MLRAEFPEVSVIALKENLGMDGYSVGFQKARGDFIFQMDNDSAMPKATVVSEVVRRFMDGPPNLAVVATRVEEYHGACDSVEALLNRDSRRGPINTGGFHAGGVGLKKRFIDKVGYYNRDVFLYGSEIFLGMKLLAEGYEILYYPEILMLHKSSSTARNSQGIFYEIRNRYWMARRFFPRDKAFLLIMQMMIHDLGYTVHKRALRSLLRAWIEGLGPLPPSLKNKVISERADFQAKLRELYATFCLSAAQRRVTNVLRQK
jgi:GT2 family glycosyltransferase